MPENSIRGDVVNVQTALSQENKKRSWESWISPVVTTMISIIVAIGLTWYQVNRSEQEARKAELERTKSVKTTLVNIVEDHVINSQPMDIKRLSRLIDTQSREANIVSTPRLLEIVQIAELNIINSGYLDFPTKENFKKVFDEIYVDIRKDYKIDLSGTKNKALIEQVVSNIKVGNSEESLSNLQLLIEAYSSDIQKLESLTDKKSPINRLTQTWLKDPLSLATLPLAYIIIFLLYYKIRLGSKIKKKK